ncbi:MAG: hypothetical protein WCY72_13335 [Lysobacteraceae bacterium]
MNTHDLAGKCPESALLRVVDAFASLDGVRHASTRPFCPVLQQLAAAGDSFRCIGKPGTIPA